MSDFDQLIDDLTEADRQNPSMPQMIEPDDESIGDDTTELSLKKKRIEFDSESGKTQDRDKSGKWTKEGKSVGTTHNPRLPGMTEPESQPRLPGMTPRMPHHAAEFYSPNSTNMTFHSALDAMNGERQQVALEVTYDVDFQLGLKGRAHDAIGDWSDGAENSVVNEINNIQDFDELRYSAALKGKQLHQKAVLAFEEDADGRDLLYSMSVPSDNIAILRANLDSEGIEHRTILPEGMNTRIMVYGVGDNRVPKAPGNPIMLEKLKKLATHYTLDENDKETLRIEVRKGTGEFVGEAEGRTEAGENYDKIIRDYERKYPNRRRYQQAEGPRVDDNRSKVVGTSGSTSHLLSEITSKTGNHGGSSTVYFAKFADGTRGVWKPGGKGNEGAERDNVPYPHYPREVAAYEVGTEVGMGEMMTPTILRTVDGEEGSMQEFNKGAEVAAVTDSQYEYDGDDGLSKAAAFDYLIGNTDRHGQNWMITNKDHKIKLIDNGASFPNNHYAGWVGNRRFIEEAQYRGMDIPVEAKTWVDHLPQVEKIMRNYGLDDEEVAGVRKRANDLFRKERFDQLGSGFNTGENNSDL